MLVTSVVLYGCEVWGGGMTKRGWRQLERIQKHLINSNIKVKALVPYEILLAEADMYLLEATTMTRLISCLKKLENMDNQHWPKSAMKEGLARRRKTWVQQNIKWLSTWNIKLQDFSSINVGKKKFVMGKFQTAMWSHSMGWKKIHYIEVFDPSRGHGD